MTTITRVECGACGFGPLEQILDLGDSPVANQFPTKPADGSEDRYQLGLVRCPKCTLVQSTVVVDDEVVWGGEYAFYTSASAELRSYFGAYAEWAMTHYPQQARGFLVEIGCNDGTLLDAFSLRGVDDMLGIDPATGPTQAARDRGLAVLTEAFDFHAASAIRDAHGQASMIVANNVAAHVHDLRGFVAGIKHLLAPGGVVILEVQYLPDLVAGNGFDLVYHEHRSFFSATSLCNATEAQGLTPIDISHQPTQGGSIRVVLVHGTPIEYPVVSAQRVLQSEEWLSAPHLQGLQGRADRIRTRLVDTIGELRSRGNTIAAYGAPAKATTLFAWAGLHVGQVGWIEDTTPGKIGRYLPGTAIPIVPPTHDVDQQPGVYLLTIHNYARAIIRNELRFMQAGGRFLLPLPVPQVL